MNCPKCGYDKSIVIDSRPDDVTKTVRRRRECLDCGSRFTTYEHTMKQLREVAEKAYRRLSK